MRIGSEVTFNFLFVFVSLLMLFQFVVFLFVCYLARCDDLQVPAILTHLQAFNKLHRIARSEQGVFAGNLGGEEEGRKKKRINLMTIKK